MENLLEKINSCPINAILDLLGIVYWKQGNILALWQDGKITDGWRANISSNYVNDFSMKDRAIWWPYSFVKKYLNLSDKETFDWFYTYFGITHDWNTFHRKKKQVSSQLPVIRYIR